MGKGRFRWIGSMVAPGIAREPESGRGDGVRPGGQAGHADGLRRSGGVGQCRRGEELRQQGRGEFGRLLVASGGGLPPDPNLKVFVAGKFTADWIVPRSWRQPRVEGQGVRQEPGCSLRRHGLGQDAQRGVRHVFARELLPPGGEADRGLGRDGRLPLDGPDQPGRPAPGHGGRGVREHHHPDLARSGELLRTAPIALAPGYRTRNRLQPECPVPGGPAHRPGQRRLGGLGSGRAAVRPAASSGSTRYDNKAPGRIGAGGGWSSGRG